MARHKTYEQLALFRLCPFCKGLRGDLLLCQGCLNGLLRRAVETMKYMFEEAEDG